MIEGILIGLLISAGIVSIIYGAYKLIAWFVNGWQI
jgi:hypothetical protein